MSDLKDFLENIRKHSDRIGEIAMKHVGSLFDIFVEFILRKYNFVAFRIYGRLTGIIHRDCNANLLIQIMI